MNEGPAKPRWFRFLYRLSAIIALISPAVAVLIDVFSVRVAWIAKASAWSILIGSLAFLFVAWCGVVAGYVRASSAVLFTLLFLGFVAAVFIFTPLEDFTKN